MIFVYDPVGLISPEHLLGKLLDLEICDTKLPWDETVSTGTLLQQYQ